MLAVPLQVKIQEWTEGANLWYQKIEGVNQSARSISSCLYEEKLTALDDSFDEQVSPNLSVSIARTYAP